MVAQAVPRAAVTGTGLYYIGMAANRCRYKHRAAVNKYDNGGQNERKRGITWDAIWDTTV